MRAALFIASTILMGCAAVGVYDGDQRYVGGVQHIEKVSRANEPPGVLMAFGLIGGLMYAAADRFVQTNLYTVHTGAGDFLWVQADEEPNRSADLWQLATAMDLEGIVAKRADSTYTAGRSDRWQKVKTAAGEERERSRRHS